MALTDAQIATYRNDGFLVVEDVLDTASLGRIRDVIADFKDRARSIAASNAIFDVGPGHSHATPQLRRLKDPVDRHPVFEILMRSDAIVSIVQDLLGPAVRFDHSKLNFKPAGGSAGIEWHQDWAFYPHTNDDLLAVGVMIEDCTPENGPLMVIPGSHRGPIYDHHANGIFVGGIRPADIGADLERVVTLTAPAGAISIHHVRTLHASGENRSDRERPLLLYSYAAVDAFPVCEAMDLEAFDRRIVRGEPTLAPRATGVPMRLPYPRDEAADSIFDNQAGMLADEPELEPVS
ncbi:MAG: phytanoyl-CoA dioxygenase family protein [Pseudomonadota bacterium]